MAEENQITQLLVDWRGGRQQALDEALPLIFDGLHRIAQKYMRLENPGHTLQPTAIVNEAYLKLVDVEIDWQNRAHFFAVAARMMRRILVDHAKAKHRDKRGGDATRLSLDDVSVSQPGADVDVLELDIAMQKLAQFDERKCQVVELQFFGGLNYQEIAAVLKISEATVDRELRFAKAWLHREMSAAE